jgi:RNA polymerase sigma-70 factor (ECF subfamily)
MQEPVAERDSSEAPPAGWPQSEFADLYTEHSRAIYYLTLRFLGDPEKAADATHDVFLKAFRKLDQFRGEARFSTWLYRIAYSCFLQACRKQRWPAAHVDESEVEQLPAPPQAIDLQLDLERAMQQLSAAEQTVLLHCVQMDLSHEETAHVLAMPLGTVKTHATRGKAKLRAWLAVWHEAAGKEQTS